MGAGDVKLLSAVGAWVGPVHILGAFVVTGVVGGLMAGAMIARSGDVRPALGPVRRDQHARSPRSTTRSSCRRSPRGGSRPCGSCLTASRWPSARSAISPMLACWAVPDRCEVAEGGGHRCGETGLVDDDLAPGLRAGRHVRGESDALQAVGGRRRSRWRDVLVAARDLKVEEVLKEDMLAGRRLPKASLPPGTFDDAKHRRAVGSRSRCSPTSRSSTRSSAPKGSAEGLVVTGYRRGCGPSPSRSMNSPASRGSSCRCTGST